CVLLRPCATSTPAARSRQEATALSALWVDARRLPRSAGRLLCTDDLTCDPSGPLGAVGHDRPVTGGGFRVGCGQRIAQDRPCNATSCPFLRGIMCKAMFISAVSVLGADSEWSRRSCMRELPVGGAQATGGGALR